MVKVPRPEAIEKKPGMVARAIVEYFIFATGGFDATKGMFLDMLWWWMKLGGWLIVEDEDDVHLKE